MPELKLFRLTVVEVRRLIYEICAENSTQAKEMFEKGNLVESTIVETETVDVQVIL
jgi:hypothetical protein